jgi:hypothetical protein
MKKIVSIFALVAGAFLSAQAQQISVQNLSNGGGAAAATGGTFFTNNVAGTALGACQFGTINLQVLGGASSGSLTPIGTFSMVFAGLNGGGLYLDGSGLSYVVSGVGANGTAFLELFAWTGAFANFAAAVASGTSYVATSGVFQNPTGGTPPNAPASLTGMPSMTLVLPVPEPAITALLGLGAASLLIFRRRK